ncbi:hypothetical protein A3C09_02080 [Candidatus Uhrbacteria bacterium RIFCSPHIGHO2_02_FULL_47_44]|uniref:Cupin type-2 domain-containing protein n=1 Tax=Candidatus Uhrbacteria bacterium RIFCSPLOWO2_02_FULL_48_18 TaxID=1802408 RepID=A0A1F7VBQ9_9BACT|nr:MAG: hypothetical protein A2839_00455 [Candidatus Uhrbacteria bacterium RIFCSPHIGHO2_01_FULL_47_10]OGL70468.1 MAG: hypothetical protein A3C09_02080 [Candidatus Uhrbacteria bacterium RIFCSPHIGHO2_02_FULL_47_44]OGL76840.1 MAG: hypothetical protein A3E97_01695 [Candidatus Uhrbacteria bacterium RIFCSPHIGHO2_12_FULL_47_12]OGL82309.1 MAG: hypothetical protein A3B20_00975 [Candidatus Uhrbacteria bacterium RIFCSPLOWO2_01_FULL_47_17]OGL87956.1 MAG: hypothetical protein A3I41_02505 [Candidatus Uhrbact
MTESEWIVELQNNGYNNLLFWDAIPFERDDEHAHDRDHKMIIFSGDVEVTIGYETVHLGAHDYFEIPRGTNHMAVVGAEGCRYLIAERL